MYAYTDTECFFKTINKVLGTCSHVRRRCVSWQCSKCTYQWFLFCHNQVTLVKIEWNKYTHERIFMLQNKHMAWAKWFLLSLRTVCRYTRVRLWVRGFDWVFNGTFSSSKRHLLQFDMCVPWQVGLYHLDGRTYSDIKEGPSADNGFSTLKRIWIKPNKEKHLKVSDWLAKRTEFKKKAFKPQKIELRRDFFLFRSVTLFLGFLSYHRQ